MTQITINFNGKSLIKIGLIVALLAGTIAGANTAVQKFKEYGQRRELAQQEASYDCKDHETGKFNFLKRCVFFYNMHHFITGNGDPQSFCRCVANNFGIVKWANPDCTYNDINLGDIHQKPYIYNACGQYVQ